MSKQKIKLEVEGLKVEPLKFFMEKQGKDLEQEVVKAIDEMYQKYVPMQTREYIDYQLKDENQESVQEQEASGNRKSRSSDTGKMKKTSRSQKNTQNEAGVQTDAVDQNVEAETQEAGMTQQM